MFSHNMIIGLIHALLFLFVGVPWAVHAQEEASLDMVINADQGATTISRHVYGHFAEHLGRDIYGGF